MRALKALVVVLGIMIVVATGLVVYGIVAKLGNNVGDVGNEQAGVYNQTMSVSSNSEVKDFVVGDNRLVIKLSKQEGTDQFFVFDLSTGKQLGSIMLEKKDDE